MNCRIVFSCKANWALIALVLIFMNLLGCRVLRWRSFEPAQGNVQIVMFGNYVLRIDGYASGLHNLFVDLDYRPEIRDTTFLDTLPILVLDSLRFHGNCLDSSFSVHPQTWAETQPIKPGIFYRGKPQSNIPFRYDDLYYFNGIVVPGGFEVNDAFRLPSSCVDLDVSVEIQARLLDRKTGAELARESKLVQLEIKDRKKRVLGS